MSHFKQFCYGITLIFSILASASLAYADVIGSGGSSVTFDAKKSVNYAAPLSQITTGDPAIRARVLDWRQTELELNFDLSEADIIDELELLLTADPLGKVNPQAPIRVTFNGGAPVRIITRGQGFDSRIRLNTGKVRAKNNILKLEYETPRGQDCVMPNHGGWLVDLEHSKLVVKGRAKSRALQLREVELRLDLPAIAPRRVGLIATGPNATALQALAAQGTGLRIDTLPQFTTTKGVSDFEIIMARRDQLGAYTHDATLLKSVGPRLFVPRGRPMRLFITADTDDMLLQTVQSFATHRLPKARRQITSLGEMHIQPKLNASQSRIFGKTPLTTLSGFHSGSDWQTALTDLESAASEPQVIRFNVEDPAATSGQVVLKMAAGEDIAPDSRVSVALNGRSLGSAKLVQGRKTASFQIRPGSLQGLDNVLTLTPELKTHAAPNCAAMATQNPSFRLQRGSKLVLKAALPSPVTDLSRLAASGGVLAEQDGAETAISLPRNSLDYHASLRFLAQIAKAHGGGLAEAEYVRGNFTSAGSGRHHLTLARADNLPTHLREAAPAAFDNAVRGQAISGDNLLSAAYGQYASMDNSQLLANYAANFAADGRVQSGGVATMFATPDDPSRVTAIVTNTPGQSFSAAIDQLVQKSHWNEMEGGVARWNNRSVLMAQTASPVPGYVKPKVAAPRLSLQSLDDWANNLDTPEWNISAWSLPSASDVKAFGSNMGASVRTKLNGLKRTITRSSKAPSTPAVNPSSEPFSETVQSVIPQLRGPSILPKRVESKRLMAKRKILDTGYTVKVWWKDRVQTIKTSEILEQTSRKIDRWQDNLQPLGSQIKSTFKPKSIPGVKQMSWGQHNLSHPAIYFLLVVALLLLLLGFAKPPARRY